MDINEIEIKEAALKDLPKEDAEKIIAAIKDAMAKNDFDKIQLLKNLVDRLTMQYGGQIEVTAAMEKASDYFYDWQGYSPDDGSLDDGVVKPSGPAPAYVNMPSRSCPKCNGDGQLPPGHMINLDEYDKLNVKFKVNLGCPNCGYNWPMEYDKLMGGGQRWFVPGKVVQSAGWIKPDPFDPNGEDVHHIQGCSKRPENIEILDNGGDGNTYWQCRECATSSVHYNEPYWSGDEIKVFKDNSGDRFVHCKCGADVPLVSGWTNPCPGKIISFDGKSSWDCNREYNLSGQMLGPRSQWGEETGENFTDRDHYELTHDLSIDNPNRGQKLTCPECKNYSLSILDDGRKFCTDEECGWVEGYSSNFKKGRGPHKPKQFTQTAPTVQGPEGKPYVVVYRGMSDKEYKEWQSGDPVNPGKYFTSMPRKFFVDPNIIKQTDENTYTFVNTGILQGEYIKPIAPSAFVQPAAPKIQNQMFAHTNQKENFNQGMQMESSYIDLDVRAKVVNANLKEFPNYYDRIASFKKMAEDPDKFSEVDLQSPPYGGSQPYLNKDMPNPMGPAMIDIQKKRKPDHKPVVIEPEIVDILIEAQDDQAV